jgi:hypothetical protein
MHLLCCDVADHAAILVCGADATIDEDDSNIHLESYILLIICFLGPRVMFIPTFCAVM